MISRRRRANRSRMLESSWHAMGQSLSGLRDKFPDNPEPIGDSPSAGNQLLRVVVQLLTALSERAQRSQ